MIGLLLVAAIALSGYVSSRPRKGTIDYHKEQIAELSRIGGGVTGWRKVLGKVTGIRVSWRAHPEKREREINWHMDRLRELGFWEQRDYLFTNRVPAIDLIRPKAAELVNNPSVPNTPFYFFVFYAWTNAKGSNVFSVKVPRTEIARWDTLVSKLDVAEK
jgi:hypothetical protein